MFQKLVSHNEDLGRLVVKGYAVGFDTGYLIVRDIPYLDDKLALRWGAIVSKLVFVDEVRVGQEDHQIFFAGSHPHNLDATAIPNLGGGLTTLALSEANKDVAVERSFSNKPRVNGQLVGFGNFFDKIESYVAIIAGPAIELYGANPYTFRITEAMPDSVFKFHDTLTSRAEIGDLAAKFKDDIVAVIGLGGTGSYLLDLLVRMPVKEIRAFDFDRFYVHNAYRSPGPVTPDEFGTPKATLYERRYQSFRTGLSGSIQRIDASSTQELEGVTFAFVCADKGSSRAGVFDLLIARRIPFIDVGMGLKRRKEGTLAGMARITYFSPENAEAMRQKGHAPLSDPGDDVYRANIQLGELNALNASLAALKFKQLRGFYSADIAYDHLLFGLSNLKLTGEA